MTERSDAQLLELVHQADPQACAELVQRHGRYLFGVARALVRDAHEAEDVVQEALAAVLTSEYRGDASVRTYLVGIVVRQAALVRRKRKTWLRLWRPADDQQRDERRTHDQQAADVRMDLTDMLAKLTPEHRDVLVLRELEGLTYEQIAKLLDIPKGTVESRLHRARQQLREQYADQELHP